MGAFSQAVQPWLQAAMHVVVGAIVLAVAWDLIMACCGVRGASISEAMRVVNRDSEGLLALGWLALWFHVFLLPYMPPWWH